MPGSPSPHNRPRAAPASAPPNAKRSRDDASRPSADAQLWVELTDAALNDLKATKSDLKATKSDLKATKTKLASVQAVVLQQNTLIKQQTSTITDFVDTRKPSRVVEALKELAKLAPTVTTDVIAKTALNIATRLDTEAGGG
jgi:septal ring factor EnvC (AmiA/AmiB activator)